ncbi:MAG: hypothetical protein OEY87_06705 [Gammaproteobacteria bacterium]|nr:hypothetical protein [Gammaproteobacteria bacterium]MDH5735797.1 hypothetical protein [Gammaproteobacteria bacterium]
MNIVEYKGAQAVSTDGIHWDIYVRDNDLVSDLTNSHKVQTNDIRYGRWSETQGLKRGALYPSESFKNLEHQGAVVYQYLLKHHQDIPFAFKDNYELWLLDYKNRPLALLKSAIKEDDIELDTPLSWNLSIDCRKNFYTNIFKALCTNQQFTNPADYLISYINGFASNTRCAQWFKRDNNGDATGIEAINLETDLIKRQLSCKHFPAFYIQQDNHDAVHEQLISDFLCWQAPFFLLLDNLDYETRSRLEHQARQRAPVIDEIFHLYPEIINQDIINAARVEALFRRTNPEPEDSEEIMCAEYIELNIPRTN